MSIARYPADGGMTFSKSVAIAGQGTWVYLSGQVGTDGSGKVVPGGTEAETVQTFENLIAAVTEAGGSRDDIVRITGYLTSLDDYSGYSAARKKVFGDKLPASTAVQVAGLLLGAHVEVDAVAFIPAD
jgi:2-iminobutanoate/2-iminopropanoate deaminase